MTSSDSEKVSIIKPLQVSSKARRKRPLSTIEPFINEDPWSSQHKKRLNPASRSPRQLEERELESNNDSTESFVPDLDYKLPPISSEELICFGMICGLRAEILDGVVKADLLNDSTEVNDSSPGYFPTTLNFQDRYISLSPIPSSSTTGSDFAVLDERTSKALRNIQGLGFSRSRFETRLSTETLNAIFEKHEKKRYITFDVVVYGSWGISKSVDRFLTSAKLWLQPPDPMPEDTEYDNPHFLKFDGPASVIMNTDENTVSYSVCGQSDGGFTTTELEKGKEVNMRSMLRNKVTKIFDSLTRFRNLEKIDATIDITTPLFGYQKEALDFIAQREFGPIPDEYSLWKSELSQNKVFYEHVITGQKLEAPPIEFGGGILADAMGLGKTLTMIANIIRTTAQAREFLEENYHPQDVARNDETDKCTSRLHSRSTLVIVQSSLLIDEWRKEVEIHCPGLMNITVYHGRGRDTDPNALVDLDIVMSTYHTIMSEMLDPESPIYHIKWFRIVLDEAHIIRCMTTKIFRAMSNISANIRWCLTGTPIQNSLEDLAALVSFIQLSPLDNIREFRKSIISPLMRDTDKGPEKLRILLDSICLRRTKKLLNLPDVEDITRKICFSPEEQSVYDSIQQKMIQRIKQLGDGQARNKKGYFGIFQLQLQLRRLANHGTFEKKVSTNIANDLQFDPEEALAFLKEKKDSRCRYCNVEITGLDLDATARGRFTYCGRLLCFGCIHLYKKDVEHFLGCSVCGQKREGSIYFADEITAKGPITSMKSFINNGISSKVSALLDDIKRNPTKGKSIVFSCWTTSLDLVGHHLTLHKLPFVRIDGSYSTVQRHNILQRYDTDPSTHILLMTTGTGAVGLNLTIATCVYILEPQWNPMVEAQAVARVQRVGQDKNVTVIRYVVQGTEEMNVLSQQSRKLGYAKIGWASEETTK